MQVSEAMHNGVEWVAPDVPIAQLARTMKEKDIGAIPVGENDRLIGMVTDRDIAIRAFANGRDPTSLTARDVMSAGIVYCRTDEAVEDAVRIMEMKKIRRLPVINNDKRMVGMLSIGDISHASSQDIAGELMHSVAAHHG